MIAFETGSRVMIKGVVLILVVLFTFVAYSLWLFSTRCFKFAIVHVMHVLVMEESFYKDTSVIRTLSMEYKTTPEMKIPH